MLNENDFHQEYQSFCFILQKLNAEKYTNRAKVSLQN